MISGCCTFFCLLYLLVIYRSFLVCLPTVTLQLQRRYATITTNRSSVDILLVRQPLATAVLFCAWHLLDRALHIERCKCLQYIVYHDALIQALCLKFDNPIDAM